MCRAQERWTEAFPLVLGMRMAIKEDLQASVLELVYVEPLRIPGELLAAPPTTGAKLSPSSSSECARPLRKTCRRLCRSLSMRNHCLLQANFC